MSEPERGGRRVVASGVFDIIHPGHLHFLRRARELGDRLCVIVASDEQAARSKRAPVHSQPERVALVSALRVVDEVIPGPEPYDLVATARRADPHVIALGYDQDFDEAELRDTLTAAGIAADIVRIPRYPRRPARTRALLEEL